MNLSLFTQPAAVIGQPATMSSREIADLTGKEHKHVIRDIRTMLDALKDGPDLGHQKDDPVLDHVREDKDARGYTTAIHLNKELTLTLVAGYDAKLRLAIIKRWQDLESKVSAPAAPAIAHTPLTHDIAALELAARVLNVSESGKLGMVRHAFKHHAPHLLPALPGYAVDAPRDVVVAGGSSMVTASATSLLKKHGISMSPAKFNERLSEYGLLVQAQRPSKGGEFKKFWCVTPSGESYGKNITSPVNQRETQPHWFVDRFSTLLAGVGLA